MKIIFFFFIFWFSVACVQINKEDSYQNISLICTPNVPIRFTDYNQYAPLGESDKKRYIMAYEAFWWNVICVKAKDLKARVPFCCNRNEAASYGGSDGADDAFNSIQQLLKNNSEKKVKAYLIELSKNPDGKVKMECYFAKPTIDEHGL